MGVRLSLEGSDEEEKCERERDRDREEKQNRKRPRKRKSKSERESEGWIGLTFSYLPFPLVRIFTAALIASAQV